MASNRDPRKAYRRRNRTTITSSSNRSARSKKSTVPKPTSSSTRSSTKGSSSRVTTGQGGSRARVKTKPKSTGIIGSTGNAKSTYVGPPGTGKPPKFNPKNRVVKTATRGTKVATLLNPRSDIPARLLAGAGLAADLLGNKPKPKKTKTKPTPGMDKGAVAKAKADAAETNRQSKAASFDRAFASARKAGKKTFVWNGKTYTTKLK